ncbi:MAG: hypothetical protein ILP07_04520 [Treponema sp.]|nr:hypothetical protein [Treponema sp.]
MNTFILRWNPAISSYKMAEHKNVCRQIKEKEPVLYNWSIREWQELHAGDAFVLLQVGTDNDGIAMIGKFISEPYEANSWRKDGSMIHYADIHVFYACDLDEKKFFRSAYFESKFPAIKWHGGHSGEKVSAQDSNRLITRIDFAMKNTYGFESTNFTDFLQNDNRFMPINQEAKKEELLALLAPYNPVVHTGEEENYDWLFDEEEFAIEIKNPSSVSPGEDICIAFEDSVNSEFTLYFAGWHEYFKMNEGDYARFLDVLKSILENKVYLLEVFDKKRGLEPIFSQLLPVNQSKVKMVQWNDSKSSDVKL